MESKINVVLFSGGRGAASLTTALLNHEQIMVTVLVNAYDDGLSTGLIRNLIPGMLGPSDLRKNIFRQIEHSNPDLAELLEYRFPQKSENVLRFLYDISNGLESKFHLVLVNLIKHLKLWQAVLLKEYIRNFLENTDEKKLKEFNFNDCSFGNIILAGCYIKNKNDFNESIKEMSEFAEIKGKVLNITDGKNYVLIALKEDGKILLNEAEIVSKQNELRIKDIFLLKEYLSKADLNYINSVSFNEKLKYLEEISYIPELNLEAETEIANADVIIYGPGTQHSSLFPSYLTARLAETIYANKKSEKIFIGNINYDHEIQSETCNSLAEKFLYYMNLKGKKNFLMNDFATYFFFQLKNNKNSDKYILFHEDEKIFPKDRVMLSDWEDSPGKHLGGRILEEIIGRVNQKLELKIKDFMHLVSIIIPVRNEERTISKVINELNLINFQKLGLSKEIIVVDGDSTDKTYELVSKFDNVKLYRTSNLGRGHCLRTGLANARGNIIVFFPGDDEYNSKEIINIVSHLSNTQDCQVIFGSRSIKCIDIDKIITHIYGNNFFGYFTSKWGGRILSILSLLLYNRYIGDPLTSVKGFNARFIKSLDLKSNGVELEMELIAKISKTKNYILETPVSYKPRTRAEGKKMNLWSGLKCIFILIYFYYSKKGKVSESIISYNSSLQ